jgi:crotonobetainyl-CoA:carnitine CoA-transferase CaiB-like acyl-CoA transferase
LYPEVCYPQATAETYLSNRLNLPKAGGWCSLHNRRPPEFGEQTDEVLAEFGFSTDEIAELRQGKVV